MALGAALPGPDGGRTPSPRERRRLGLAERLIAVCTEPFELEGFDAKRGSVRLLEPVMRERVLDRVRELGCHHAQGFLLAKPLEVLEADALLAQRTAALFDHAAAA